MGWTREGICNQCGECCYAIANFMRVLDTTMTPRPKTGQYRCKFLKQQDSIFICEITAGLFSGEKHGSIKIGSNYKRKPNGDLQEITQEMYDYWLNECKSFPNPNDPAHCPPAYNLPSTCGFTMVES